MMSLPPTTLLMLCLGAATLLGAGIGACLWYLVSASRLRRALAPSRGREDAEREAFDASVVRENAAPEQPETVAIAARARERTERIRSRHDTLVAHARAQARRIASLEAEIAAHEVRHRKRERDTANRAPRRLEGRADGSRPAAPDENDLPVLSRRVRGGDGGDRAARPTLGSAPRAMPGPDLAKDFPIGSDLDIPALAESELPEAADDLALGLLDARSRPSGTDE